MTGHRSTYGTTKGCDEQRPCAPQTVRHMGRRRQGSAAPDQHHGWRPTCGAWPDVRTTVAAGVSPGRVQADL